MKVMVLDDNMDDLRQIRRVMSSMPNIQGMYFQDPHAALTIALEGKVDVLVCDINMPEMSGIDLVRKLRASEGAVWLPTIFLTGDTRERQAESLRNGGDAVLTKPLMPSLFMAQLSSFERLIQQRQKLILEQQDSAVDDTLDSLTGLWNSQGLNLALDEALGLARINQGWFSLLVLDIDGFGLYNEHYGEKAGDVALQTVAGAIRFSLDRNGDVAARMGNDRFVVGLGNSDIPYARQTAAVIQETLTALRMADLSSGELALSLSIGISAEKVERGTVERLYRQADAALQACKKAGGNRVGLYRPLGDPVVYSPYEKAITGSVERLDR